MPEISPRQSFGHNLTGCHQRKPTWAKRRGPLDSSPCSKTLPFKFKFKNVYWSLINVYWTSIIDEDLWIYFTRHKDHSLLMGWHIPTSLWIYFPLNRRASNRQPTWISLSKKKGEEKRRRKALGFYWHIQPNFGKSKDGICRTEV